MNDVSSIGQIVIDGAVVDLTRHEVLHAVSAQRLSPQEVKIIRTFMQHGTDATLTREDLYQQVWGYAKAPQGRAIDYAMQRLRKKLGAPKSSQVVLGTIRGVGFRLVWSPQNAPSPKQSAPQPFAPIAPPPTTAPAVPRPQFEVVGRDEIVQRAIDHLTGHATLVTLLGPGGIGKSTIAMQVCRGLPDWKIAWVELERVPHGDVESELVQAIVGSTNRDLSLSQAIDAWRKNANRGALIVLDGAEEHLYVVAEILDLLPDYERVRFLLTSRRKLNITREVTLGVPPLSAPDACELLLAAGKRKGMVIRPVQSELDELLERLDGVPLALEIAAGRLRSRRPRDLVRVLDAGGELSAKESDRNARQYSMLTVAEDAVMRLPESASEVLYACSAFAGPFSIDGISWVVDNADLDIDDVIDELLDAALLHVDPNDPVLKFRILNPIRQALVALNGEPSDALRRIDEAVDEFCGPDLMRRLQSLIRMKDHPLVTHARDALESFRRRSDDGLDPKLCVLILEITSEFGTWKQRQEVTQRIERVSTEDEHWQFARAQAAYRAGNNRRLRALLPRPVEHADTESRLLQLRWMKAHFLDSSPEIPRIADRLARDAKAAGEHAIALQAMEYAARVVGSLEQYQNTIDHMAQIIESSSHTEDSPTWLRANDLAVAGYLRLGEFAVAVELASRAMDLIERGSVSSNPLWVALFTLNRAIAHQRLGNWDAVRDDIAKLSDPARNAPLPLRILGQVVSAETELLTDNQRRGLSTIQSALNASIDVAEPVWENEAWAVWASWHLHYDSMLLSELNDRRAGLRSIKSSTATFSDSRLGDRVQPAVHAWLDARLGEEERARRVIEQPDPFFKTGRLAHWWATAHAAELLHMKDKRDECVRKLQDAVLPGRAMCEARARLMSLEKWLNRR